MGVVIRKSIYTSVINYLGVFIGALNIIVFLPKFLSTEEFGLMRALVSAGIIVTQLAQFGFPNVILKFYPGAKKAGEKQPFISKLLGWNIIILLFSCAVILLFEEAIAAQFKGESVLFTSYFLWIIPIFLSSTIFNFLFAIARMEGKLLLPFFFKDMFLRLFNLALIGLYMLETINFDQFLMAFVLSYPVQFFLMFGFILLRWPKLLSFKAMFGKFPLSAKGWKRYAAFIFLGSISVVILGNIDVIMITKFRGLEEAAIYSVAFFIAMLIVIPARSMSIVLIPDISKAWQGRDEAQIHSLYKKSALNNLIIGGAIFVGVVSNLDLAYSILPPEKGFAIGIPVVIIIGLARVTDLLSGLNNEIIALSDLYYFDLIGNLILLIVAVVGNILLIPEYGLVGAAWASAIAIVFNNILKFVFLLVKKKMQPFSYRHLLVIALLAGIYFAYKLEVFTNPWLDGVIKSVVLMGAYLLLIMSFNISPDLNKHLKRMAPFLPGKTE